MRKELTRGVWLFLNDDDGFIRWCEENPDGFFCNCSRNKAGDSVRPYMLHAMRNGKLCLHFGSLELGVASNLTTIRYCKVCSVNRKALKKWAINQGELRNCSHCIGLP
jgi:hypothetical protein